MLGWPGGRWIVFGVALAIAAAAARNVYRGASAKFEEDLRLEQMFDPNEAVGIGGALAKLASAEEGPILLGAVAVGLLAFAVFCLGQARYRAA